MVVHVSVSMIVHVLVIVLVPFFCTVVGASTEKKKPFPY